MLWSARHRESPSWPQVAMNALTPGVKPSLSLESFVEPVPARSIGGKQRTDRQAEGAGGLSSPVEGILSVVQVDRFGHLTEGEVVIGPEEGKDD